MQAAPYQSCSQSQYFKDFGCFFWGGGIQIWGSCLRYYAYRKNIGFLWAKKQIWDCLNVF